MADYNLFQIYSDSDYIYAATTSGLEIYDATTNGKICTKTLGGVQAKTVWGNNTTLYIGTVDGLYETSFTNICTNEPYISSRDLRSNYINYIHGSDDKLFISTTSGIDYFDGSNNPIIHSSCSATSIGKCFLTNTSGYYFSTVSGIDSLNRIDSCLCDWVVPSYSYVTGSGIFGTSIQLTDMFVTENTAENNGNTIFCTTTSGTYVIDEDTENYAIYYTR